MRAALRASVLAEPGDAATVLVVDETGLPTQGTHAAGVARQASGTLGKRATCQVGLFLGYASPQGQVGLDDDAVHSWQGWHRHGTRAVLALTALTLGARQGAVASGGCPRHIPITVPEVRRLLGRLLGRLLWRATRPPPTVALVVAWSRWRRGRRGRRGHQTIAQACHRRRHLSQQGEL